MDKNSKIFVAGASGLVGSALVAELRSQGYNNLLTPSHGELDLTDKAQVKWFFSVHLIEYVFFCAARVGGILDNATNKVDFLLTNLRMQTNVVENAAFYRIRKLLFVGTSCVYPRDCPQPMREEYIMTGLLEKTTEAYSIAKLAGIKLCQYYKEEQGCNFISALPCNVFGPHDNFDEQTGHCLPGIMARMVRAKRENAPEFSIWGSPLTQREFIFSEDLARGLVVIMEKYENAAPINLGSGGCELTMAYLGKLIAHVIDYRGKIIYDITKPIGTPRKVLDNSKIQALGWKVETHFLEALQKTYAYFLSIQAT